jgi:hypothetical protein
MEEQRPRAADDFATIRTRLVELRREREQAPARIASRERLDERRWQVSDELRTRVASRRWPV